MSKKEIAWRWFLVAFLIAVLWWESRSFTSFILTLALISLEILYIWMVEVNALLKAIVSELGEQRGGRDEQP